VATGCDGRPLNGPGGVLVTCGGTQESTGCDGKPLNGPGGVLVTCRATQESTGCDGEPLNGPGGVFVTCQDPNAGAGVSLADMTGSERRLVIGQMKDLKRDLQPGEYTLLPWLKGKLDSPRAYWQRNASVLRASLRFGVTAVRDASPAYVRPQHLLRNGPVSIDGEKAFFNFLDAERRLLENLGWTYDASTGEYSAP
jgi:hypothetical protein